MANIRFDLKCEGDIDEYIRFSNQRVAEKKMTEVTLGVPNMAWPPLIIQMFLDQAADVPDSDEVYISVDFDVINEDFDSIMSEEDMDELEDKIKGMTEEEVNEWIADMLSEYEDREESNEDEDDDENENKGPEGAD